MTRVFLLGASGSIGRATAQEMGRRGWSVVAAVRAAACAATKAAAPGAAVRAFDPSEPGSLARDGVRSERFDAVVSCVASRTGAPADAWAVDHGLNLEALKATTDAGAPHFVSLSAICVQKPRLAFQRAKLAFEAALAESGVAWTVVRPTAYFKSLSGQIDRVRTGRPYLLFGDGRGTACKPISDRDLAAYLCDCVERSDRRGRILPIGGPGPAVTPRAQGEALFELTGRPARFRSIPTAAISAVAGALSVAGVASSRARDLAEFARIARYYATESMLVWDASTGRYDADATPETGSDTLFEHYRRALDGEVADDRGAHAVF